MYFKNQDYFREPYFASEDYDLEDFEIELLEKECDNLLKRPPGLNKLKQRCLRGVRANYFEHAGLVFEPIIFNLDTKQVLVDYKLMNLNSKEVVRHQNRQKSPLYKDNKNICFIFFDGENYHEFLYSKSTRPENFLWHLENIFNNWFKE